ncbi:Apc15p protein-domain-containing protein [Xylaria bambusicola]|uniref:Apc15p protein-domain-containing protein n=1 Tax=Xylaria bambusicola TaxID=326684 RepID=UPI002008C5D2|nr:Apc15p protein-domain-containing protein [Xylaria bambusicola]KAI0518429.1 Apc15p protein-domain-containing protein [Xylaria bambusicola]
MFGLLPDLSPRDSHSLWYTSSRNPFASYNAQDLRLGSQNPEQGHGHPHGPNSNHRRGAHLIERSPLARLRADEQNLERRQHNVTNFGSAWLKPPGLPKTLHQLREERREAEEHQEALRREQLAQELAEAAEAEAAGAGAGEGAGDGTTAGGGDADMMLDAPPGGDDGMDDVQLDGARDLDDEIPEADEAEFGFSDNEDEDEDDEDEDDEDEDEDEEDEDAEEREMQAAQAQQQQLMAQRMRQANDAFREDMARGRDSAAFYGVDEDIDDEDQSQMIEEDDLVGAHADNDMGMDADLDDEIPEAESIGGYEHTDTEADLSSIIEGDDDNNNNNSRMSFVAPQQANRVRHSLARSDATRNSIAISDILSRDGSSVLGSSPVVPRQRTALSARRGRG